jgi:hypothetical protein
MTEFGGEEENFRRRKQNLGLYRYGQELFFIQNLPEKLPVQRVPGFFLGCKPAKVSS